MRARATAVACAVITLGTQLSAQPSAVPAGARVRLIESGTRGWTVGTMDRQASADTLWLAAADSSRALHVSQIDVLQVSRGKHRPAYKTLAPLWSIPAGMLFGGTSGIMLMFGDPDHAEEIVGWSIGLGTVIGTLGGIALARTPKREVWQPISVSTPVLASEESGFRAAPFKPGSRLRVSVGSGRPLEGTVIEQNGDTAVLSSRGTTTRVDLSAATALAVDRGRSRSLGARVGTLWGVGAGLIWGLATAASSNSHNELLEIDCDPEWSDCARESDFDTVTWKAFEGAAIGAAAGALIGKREWRRVLLPQRGTSSTHLMVAPRGRRLAVGLSAAF